MYSQTGHDGQRGLTGGRHLLCRLLGANEMDGRRSTVNKMLGRGGHEESELAESPIAANNNTQSLAKVLHQSLYQWNKP
jgi:hypothetical protein